MYCNYIVPEGSNCDVRLWNDKLTQSLNSPEKADFTYGEHSHTHTPGSVDWKNLYDNRSLAELLTSVVKNDLDRRERAGPAPTPHTVGAYCLAIGRLEKGPLAF